METVTRQECPADITDRITGVGGTNPYGEPLFRVVWGFNRIVKMTGEWPDTGAVETREVPKYLPGNRWHLEMWRPPEEYGSPETWGKLGEEIVGCMTVDTAGPFPSRGEYELCYTLSSDLGPTGSFVPLNATVVELIVNLIKKSRTENISQPLRQAAIRQRLERERQARINQTTDELLDARPAFYDTAASFRTGPKQHKLDTGLWPPPSLRN